MEEALCILKIHSIKYFKVVFLNICNFVYKTPLANLVTHANAKACPTEKFEKIDVLGLNLRAFQNQNTDCEIKSHL